MLSSTASTTHRDDARWIAFIDVDEFLFSPTGRPVSEILREFEQHPGVGVNCLVFGTSGHQTPPPGLVIENYTRRLGLDRPAQPGGQVHRRPRRAVIAVGYSAHYFRLRRRAATAVDELQQPVRGETTESLSVDLLRINHYFTRSQEERERKLAAPRVDNGQDEEPRGRRGARPPAERGARRHDPRPIAPALREALGLEAVAGCRPRAS